MYNEKDNTVIGIQALLGIYGGDTVGLRNTLNELEETGRLKDCETIGEVYRIYLVHSLEESLSLINDNK